VSAPDVATGLDRVGSGDAGLSRSARWALLTNRSAQAADGSWSGDVLRGAGYRIGLFLSPEHGLAGTAGAGDAVPHSSLDGVPVMSLYGADTAPVLEALESVDGVIADLPDAGCRYYTYGGTVRQVLHLAGARGLPVVLLDRPNPLDGVSVEGTLPDREIDSPVCASHVPVRHGLTVGELARWNVQDRHIEVELTVIPCRGWRREMDWPQTGLPWIPPSPALRVEGAARIYPGTCLLEGTTISEGRGTDTPFELIGSPSLDAEEVAEALRSSPLSRGARIEPATFTPRASKWEGQECRGVRITVEDRSFRPVAFGLALIRSLMGTADFAFRQRFFDLLAGGSGWREALERGISPEKIAESWEDDVRHFRDQREPILLYAHEEA
jgi:uncharacterized protein YbbC (DUF1343 family)